MEFKANMMLQQRRNKTSFCESTVLFLWVHVERARKIIVGKTVLNEDRRQSVTIWPC